MTLCSRAQNHGGTRERLGIYHCGVLHIHAKAIVPQDFPKVPLRIHPNTPFQAKISFFF